MIDDMEDKEAIPDRRLLARLCLLREEIDAAATSLGLYEAGSEYCESLEVYRRLLPQGAAAFLNALLPVSRPEKRYVVWLL